MADSVPKRVTTYDPHLIGRIVAVQRMRRYGTASRALEALANERLAQLELEAISNHLRPLSTPPNEPRDGRAGVASSSRRAKRSAADRSESAA